MNNRRELKKRIAYVCGQMAAECLIARTFVEGINREAIDDCIREIALLQTTSLSRVSIQFDKVPRDFDSMHAYRHARREYYTRAYKALIDEFNARVRAIVEQMNGALPRKKD